MGRLIIAAVMVVFSISSCSAGSESEVTSGGAPSSTTRGPVYISPGPEISHGEFLTLESGMSRQRVEELVGSRGVLFSESYEGGVETIVLVFEGKDPGVKALVTFTNDELVAKSQSGLRPPK